MFCAFDAVIALSTTTPNPGNPNQHGRDQLRLLGGIIQANGWRAPITISKRSGLIVKGHGRRLAALQAGLTEAPVEYQEYASEAEELADLLADNRLSELAELDDKMLLDLVEQMGTEVPIELTGFSPEDIEALLMAMNGTPDPEAEDIDSVPAIKETTICQEGDVWQLGPHRLLCGSCTDPEAIGRLIQDEKAQLVHTDPPYGVSYETQSGNFEMMANDELTGDELLGGLLQPAFQLLCKYTEPDAAFYVWHASSTRREFEDALKAVGLVEKQYLIWSKPIPVLGHADYQWSCEPCFYMEKTGEHATFYGDRTQRTVWKAIIRTKEGLFTTLNGGLVITDGKGGQMYVSDKEPKGKKLRYVRLPSGGSITLFRESSANDLWEVSRESGTIHPTQKPVELPVRAIENSSTTGDLVLDFFGGSGSTLIAAEITGRRCYMAELDPRFCDGIIRRYMNTTKRQDVTGLRAGKKILFEAAPGDQEDGEIDDDFLS